MNKILVVEGLSKTFGNVEAVKNVSFEVNEKDFIAIKGHSGSGKSTLLGLLSGLEKADGGSIKLNGKDILSKNEDELALFRRNNVGIVFQLFNLIPTLNVVENIALPLFPERIQKKEIFERARKTAESVGLSHRLNHYPGQLSGGEQQRVAIARAIINNPKILFADEPTGNLDTNNGKNILELLKRLNKENNLTIVLVTHDDSIAREADKIIELKDGEILK
jgi:putative ABC transport system ATP-binding protein